MDRASREGRSQADRIVAMPAIDWKALSQARGLDLSDAELAKLAAVMNPFELAYEAMAANLTPDVEPAITFGEEAVEAK